VTTTQEPSQDDLAGYPEIDFRNDLAGPVLSHVEAIDEFRKSHRFIRSTAGTRGFWLLSDAEMVREALQTPEIFSNAMLLENGEEPPYKWIPEMLDPPEHTQWRRLLAPHFAPRLMERMEGRVRERCVEIIESFASKGHCDFLRDFAWRYPTTIFMDLMGLPLDGLEQFLGWEHEILHLNHNDDPDRSRSIAAMMAVQGYFADLIELKRQEPGDDLLSNALTWEIDGQPISDSDMLAWCLLMFMAGLDTVSIQLSYSFWYLAGHPEDRSRLVDDPSLATSAVEEFLRYFSFVNTSRKVTRDNDFHGCPMKKNDTVMTPLSLVNRDPALFPDPESVILDRAINNHIAFGAGPHRCLGSHLARRELRVALEEWHARIPDYRLTEGVEVLEHGGMYGIDALELTWDV
jgi:cytochrome P450